MTRNSTFLAVMVVLTVALSSCDKSPTGPSPIQTPQVYAETSGLSPGVRDWALANANMPRYFGKIARWNGMVKVYVYPSYTHGAAQKAIDFWNSLFPIGSGVSLQLVLTSAEANIRIVNAIPTNVATESGTACGTGSSVIGSGGVFTSGSVVLAFGLTPPPTCSLEQVGWMHGVFTHETGHALGIEVHTPTSLGEDMMSYSVSAGKTIEGYKLTATPGLKEFMAWHYTQTPGAVVR